MCIIIALERPTRVTNKPSNVTINVGLPVTLTCYVQGDPNHYWVGWMSRQTVIQEGDEYSVSTSPNFKSPNGTIHHLTIHSVKEAGKYECKVYTIAGDFQDQVTHQIIINGKNSLHVAVYIYLCIIFYTKPCMHLCMYTTDFDFNLLFYR